MYIYLSQLSHYLASIPFCGYAISYLTICLLINSCTSFFFFFLRFYLFIHERDRERGRDTGREKQAPCREPDVGLDPEAPGSHLGLKAALNR